MKAKNVNLKQRYNLFTLIPLIVGSIIGVGSYFKIGKILQATNGNIIATILTWIIAIIIIIATSLVIISMSSSQENSQNTGGLIYIVDKHLNQHIAKLVNILVISLYTPLIIIIEAVVATKFLFVDALEINNDFVMYLFPVLFISFMIFSNFKSVIFGQIFQSLSLFVKITPLLLIIVIGLIFKPFISHETGYIQEIVKQDFFTNDTSKLIITAMPAALFALDGWQWISGLSVETIGGVKVLVKASLIGLVVAAIFYILYTLGGLNLVAARRWVHGAQVSDILKELFNINWINKMIDLFIVVSALGGLNAFSIYYIRQISSTAENKWLFKANYFAKISPKSHLPENAGKLAIVYLIFLWSVNVIANYVFAKYFKTQIGKNFDITATINVTSEVLTLGLWSFIYILLSYVAIIQRKEKEILEFKLKKPIFIGCIIIMNIGAIFAWYVNFVESPLIWFIGLFYILFLYLILPNKKHRTAKQN